MKSEKIARYKALFLNNRKIIESGRLMLALLPGAIFISLALCMLLAPQYLALFLCAFLLSFGVAALWVGHKVNQLRIKLKKMSAQIEARIFVDPEDLYADKADKSAKNMDLKSVDLKSETVIQISDGKKITYH